MNQTITTQFFLRRKNDNKIISQGNRKEILNLFKAYCEVHPKDHFIVVEKQTINKVIAESDDYRQSFLNFDVKTS